MKLTSTMSARSILEDLSQETGPKGVGAKIALMQMDDLSAALAAERAQGERERSRRDQEITALRNALERAHGCIKGLLARTPVRDVSETLGEIDAALGRQPHQQDSPQHNNNRKD